MSNYHIRYSHITNTIYAGTISKKGNLWLTKSDVTEEALASVRDLLERMAIRNERDTFGYEWTKKNGTVIQLTVKILQAKGESK